MAKDIKYYDDIFYTIDMDTQRVTGRYETLQEAIDGKKLDNENGTINIDIVQAVDVY